MKIAVTSKENRLVDMHFGHAEEYFIYSWDGKESQFIEKREVAKYCTGEDHCEESDDPFSSILSALYDCTLVLTQRIGYPPESRLNERGIMVIQTYGLIDEEIKKAVIEYTVQSALD